MDRVPESMKLALMEMLARGVSNELIWQQMEFIVEIVSERAYHDGYVTASEKALEAINGF